MIDVPSGHARSYKIASRRLSFHRPHLETGSRVLVASIYSLDACDITACSRSVSNQRLVTRQMSTHRLRMRRWGCAHLATYSSLLR